MKDHDPTPRSKIAALQQQLNEASETLRAISQGEVDAVVVAHAEGNRVYTLQTADHPYRVLVQQMNEGAIVLSRQGFILHANEHFGLLVTAPPAELNSTSIEHRIAPSDLPLFKLALERTFQGLPQRLELHLVPNPSETHVPVLLSLAPLNLTTVEAACGIVTDLRERRQHESLERAELLARSLMDLSAAAVVITDLEGKIIRANPAADAMAARPVISLPLAAAFPLELEPCPGDRGSIQDVLGSLIARLNAGTTVRGLQARLRTPHDRIIELQVSAGPFKPSDDEITGAVFTLEDVTALRTSEQRFRALTESIPQIVWTLDRNGRLTYCNQVGLDYFGRPVSELAEMFEQTIHPDDLAGVQDLWRGAVQSGATFEAEYRLLNRRGDSHWFLARAVPVRDPHGQIAQWFGTFTGMDEQKRVENDLRRANTDLEHFAYAASHDFQEPLRMVTAYAQLLQRDLGRNLDGAAAMSLRYVLEGTDRLAALLQNLLAYMQASQSNGTPMEAIDCNAVLRDVIANLKIPIEQAGATISADFLPTIVCPRIHMLELVQNLVNNAIKYRGADPPVIGISAEQRGSEWVFSVRDNGIGIAPQHQQNIFGVFKRLHGSNIPGTGIGLAICRRLVEQHQGRIWVESQLGRGSVFRFSLPVAIALPANEAHA